MKFTLRDCFWLILVVGLALGWWLDHRRLAPYLPAYRDLMKQHTALVEALGDDGITVYYAQGAIYLAQEGMGKVRREDWENRLQEESRTLPELKITPPPQ